MMYGHIDKQPHLTEQWREGLHPTQPVREGDRIYGRGVADDGYAWFTCIFILKALQTLKIPHNRVCLFFETDEESGSQDIEHYLDLCQERLGSPSLIFCLDSGTIDYEHFTVTTSLRGMVCANLKINTLKASIHSGDGSGVFPDTFRVSRMLIDRVENMVDGKLIDEFQVMIPKDKYCYACDVIEYLGDKIYERFGPLAGLVPVGSNCLNSYLNRTWMSQLTIVGDNLPPVDQSGNVLRDNYIQRWSMRLPPTLDAKLASESLKKIIEENPPHNARVEMDIETYGNGWNSKPFKPEFEKAMIDSCKIVFDSEPLYYGEGGSIPFMGLLQRKMPEAHFIVTGVLGPESNAHGPNEMLHVPFLKKLTKLMMGILASGAEHI